MISNPLLLPILIALVVAIDPDEPSDGPPVDTDPGADVVPTVGPV